MQASTFTLPATDGTEVFAHRWLPDGTPKAIVQVVHGMAEHSARYARLAEALTGAGYAVYAEDHRGHGKTAGSLDKAGFFAEASGWDTVVEDMRRLNQKAQEEHPALPVFLVGHSMGSFLSRSYAARHGSGLAGVVLSGTAGDAGALGKVGAGIATAAARLRGPRRPSRLMNTLTFGQYNAAFKPTRTDFDWLSRDNAEVDAYISDPWCGFVFTAGGYQDVLGGLASVNSDRTVSTVPKTLPIHLASGDKDPVGGKGAAGPRAVADQLRRLGVQDVTLTVWPDARHEILNETNRDEVTAEIIDWLDTHLPTR
ncbi:MAG: alpha/beta hydrolase [Nostocoides sp.]